MGEGEDFQEYKLYSVLLKEEESRYKEKGN